MKKDIHIYLDYEIANSIDSIAKKEHKKLSSVYSDIIKIGLNQKELKDKILSFDNCFKKLLSNTNYMKSLLQEIYSQGNNINEFNNNYNSKEKLND